MPRIAALSLVLLLLGGCDSPHPFSDFAAVPATRHEVDGRVFTVRVAGRNAMAVRRNVEWGAKVATIFPLAAIAMEEASGCLVVPGSLTGDVALIQAELDCRAA